MLKEKKNKNDKAHKKMPTTILLKKTNNSPQTHQK